MTSAPVINFKNYYITCLGDDYEKRMLTIVYDDHPVRYVLVTASCDDIINAAAHVYKMNPHLALRFHISGWNKDDFIENLVTFKLDAI